MSPEPDAAPRERSERDAPPDTAPRRARDAPPDTSPGPARIAYLVPGPMSRGPLGPEELKRRAEYLGAHALFGSRVEVRDWPTGPDSIESEEDEERSLPAVLEGVPALEAEGFEAVIIGCFGDPGVAEADARAGVPVIGPARASAEAAARLGARFGILTVVDGVVPSLRRLMNAYGLETTLADVRAVGIPVLEMRARRAEVSERLATEGERARAAGAEVLVLGCMTMGFLDLARELEDRLGLPVVNPVLAALRAAESAARPALSYPPAPPG